MQQHGIQEHCMDSTSSSSKSEDSEAQEEEMDFQKRVNKRMVKNGVTIFIPHDILKSKEMASGSMKNNISLTKLSAVVHSLISTCGGDPSKVSIDPSTLHRQIYSSYCFDLSFVINALH